jgi:hypothetical protein
MTDRLGAFPGSVGGIWASVRTLRGALVMAPSIASHSPGSGRSQSYGSAAFSSSAIQCSIAAVAAVAAARDGWDPARA